MGNAKASQQPRYEQGIKVVTREIMEMSKKRQRVGVLLSGVIVINMLEGYVSNTHLCSYIHFLHLLLLGKLKYVI